MKLRSILLVTALLVSAGCSSAAFVVEKPAPAPPPTTHSAKTLGIPPGQLPPPGMCRIWYPGRPPGHQPRSGSCAALARQVPPGAWLVTREEGAPGRVRVTVYPEQPAARVSVWIYSAEDGRLLEGN
jgi:hypothetical protein